MRSRTPFSIESRRCCVDARELLRRYLEQRRDLGETELVLDSLSVEDALALLGAKAGSPRAPVAPPVGTSRPTPRDVPATADWREAIRAAGGAPDTERRPRPPEPEEP